MEDRRAALLFLATILIMVVVTLPASGKERHAPTAESSKIRRLAGVIVRYECGDNCYLTIRDNDRKEHTALCAAPECKLWNERAEMPRKFIGKHVQVTIGLGDQYDGEGNLVAHMDASLRYDSGN
jgi:hypothetical protein